MSIYRSNLTNVGVTNPISYKPYESKVSGVKQDLSRNVYDRFFNSKDWTHEQYTTMFFGKPQQTSDGRLATPWEALNEWPRSYLGRNLIETVRIIWHLAAVQQLNKHISVISPLEFTNKMTHTIRTVAYSDDPAEMISISGPASEVATYITEKTHSIGYIGKATSIHANILSSPEGRQELTEKLMLVANAVVKAEIWDFFSVARAQHYSKAEEYKQESNSDPGKYFNMQKQEWDQFRKTTNGFEKALESMSNTLQNYGGKVSHMLMPTVMYSKLIDKAEYEHYYAKGNRTDGLHGQLSRSISGTRNAPLNKTKRSMYKKIKGLVPVPIASIQSTDLDLYQHVLAHYIQKGSHSFIANMRDVSLSSPEKYNKESLDVKIFDEQSDQFTLMQYGDALRHSCLFDKEGNLRDVTPNDVEVNTADLQFDPFLRRRNEMYEPIQLVGEMNVDPYYSKEWEKQLYYTGQTMCNHLKKGDGGLENTTIRKFQMMIDYLEKIPYDKKYHQEFMEMNFEIEQIDVNKTKDSVYKRDGSAEDLIVKQKEGTASYTFPSYKLPFGAANHWSIEQIASMNPSELRNEHERGVVAVAKLWVELFPTHCQQLTRILPKHRMLSEFEKFCPALFSQKKKEYVVWLNAVKNDSNFLWLKAGGPFSDDLIKRVPTTVPTTKKSLMKLFDFIKTNTMKPTLGGSGQGSPLEGTKLLSALELAEFIEKDGKGGITNITDVVGNVNNASTVLDAIKTFGYIESHYADGSKIAQSFTQDTEEIDELKRVNDLRVIFSRNRNNASALQVGGIYIGLVQALVKSNTDSMNEEDITTTDSIQKFMEENRTKSNYSIFESLVHEVTMMFNKYMNSINLAVRLSQTTNEFLQTTLTMNPRLRASIPKKGGLVNVRETMYNYDRTYMQQEPINIRKTKISLSSFTLSDMNTLLLKNIADIHGEKQFMLPYHLWYCLMILNTKGVTGCDIDMDRSLDIRNMIGSQKSDDGMLRVNDKGVFLRNFSGSMKLTTNIFERMNLIMLLTADMNAQNVMGMYLHDVQPVVEHMLSQPFALYQTLPIICVGVGALQRKRGNPLFTMGLDPDSAIIKFRYAQSSGTIVYKPQDIYIIENAMVSKSLGGCGVKWFDPLQYEKEGENYFDPLTGRYGDDSSLMSIPVPAGFAARAPVDLDIMGRHTPLLQKGFSSDDIMKVKPLYPTSVRFVSFWNIKKVALGGGSHQYEAMNTTTHRDAMLFRDKAGDFKNKIKSCTHWGEDGTYDGCERYRGGYISTPDTARIVF